MHAEGVEHDLAAIYKDAPLADDPATKAFFDSKISSGDKNKGGRVLMVAVIVSAPAELDSPVQAALRDLGFACGQDGQWRGEIDGRQWAEIERALGLSLDDAGPWT